MMVLLLQLLLFIASSYLGIGCIIRYLGYVKLSYHL
jgi:hypothetical protein